MVMGDLQALLMEIEMYGAMALCVWSCVCSHVCHDTQVEAPTAVFAAGWEPVRCQASPRCWQNPGYKCWVNNQSV